MIDPSISRGVSFADYDRDGRMDMYVANLQEPPTLYRNVTPIADGNHWLEVLLTGTVSNRDACGAIVTAVVNGGTLIRPKLCGSSLGAGNDPALLFGLGPSPALTIRVQWPSGAIQTISNPPTDALLEVVEPASG